MSIELNTANTKPWYARPRIANAPEGFAQRLSQTRVTLDTAARYAPCVLASSLSVEDMVLFHLIATAKLPIQSFALDTGKLPAATLALWDQIEAQYERSLERVTPELAELAGLNASQSDSAIYETKAARARCCDVRKTTPLRRQLTGKAAWVTGLRKAQSAVRASVPHQSWDSAFSLEKFNPLADWTDDDLWYFVDRENIPVSALYSKGYASIGCDPCTRPIRFDEHPRAGRWWWEAATDTTTGTSTECGIHVAAPLSTNNTDTKALV
jgi:phosphoadenosine phosphosulfate reductase